MDFDKLVELAAALNREEAEYIVFGGAAVNLHGIIRATEDYDIFVRPEPENVARIKRALRAVWNDPAIDDILDDDMIGGYPSIRYGPPETDLYVDFVSRLGEAFHYDDLEAEVHDIEGVAVRVATPATLVRMKRDTIRDKDRQDASRLMEKFGLPEDL